MIDSIDVVIYSAYFLIPGYVINEIIRHFLPDREHNDFEKTIRCLEYSILELALWYWLFSIVSQKYDSSTYRYWLFLILTVVVTSFITGIAIGILRKGQLFRKTLDFFGIHTEHPVPTGWDYKFSNTETPRWVCICLNNGTFVRGRYGPNSLASSEKDDHDIYLEEVFIKNNHGSWSREERTDGIWISASSIVWINFYKDEEAGKDGKR